MKPYLLVPVKLEGLENIAKELLGETSPDMPPQTEITPARNVNSPESYLILPGKTHGSYSYPDTLVAMEKTHHNKNWRDTQEALRQDHAFVLTIRQFVDFLSLLKSGNAYDGRGRKVAKGKLDAILDEIITIRNPVRAEHLDADFKHDASKGLYIYHTHRYVGGSLKPKYAEKLEDCLMENKTPGIDLDDWLKNATSQGLPKNNVNSGNKCKMYYWAPMTDNNSVARFSANSGGAGLGCDGSPSYSDRALGVRVAREK